MTIRFENIFEEAFYSETERLILIDEIKTRFKVEKDFKDKFSDTLFCPYCRMAELSFVSGSHPYLRIKLKRFHDESCHFKLLVISQKVLYKYYNQEHNFSEIYRYLKECAEVYFDVSGHKTPTLADVQMVSDFSDVKITEKLHSHRILRKNLNNGVSKNDFHTIKLFYGQAILMPKCKLSAPNQYLHIVSPKTQKSICSLNMPMSSYNKRASHTPISENKLYNITFLGEAKESENGKYYYNINLVSPYHLFMQETSSEYSSESTVK